MILMLMMMMFTLILVQMSDYSEGDANDDDVNDGGWLSIAIKANKW